MKILFLDTCSVVKILVPEAGHDVMMWLLSSDAVLQYHVLLVTSTHVRDEFPRTVTKMIKHGQIRAADEKGILMRARGHLHNNFPRLHCVDVDKPPQFRVGSSTTADALITKHKRKEKDRTDLAQLSTVINYLRCFVGGALPHVVTSDKRFKSIIRKEGFGVLDPEKLTISQIQEYFDALDKT